MVDFRAILGEIYGKGGEYSPIKSDLKRGKEIYGFEAREITLKRKLAMYVEKVMRTYK